LAEEKLLPHKKAAIEKQLLSDHRRRDIEFVEAEYQTFKIHPKDAHSAEHEFDYKWEMEFTVLSDVYNCIEIFPNETAVCYKDADKEIKFIDVRDLKMIVA
jgi:hypothetical protein